MGGLWHFNRTRVATLKEAKYKTTLSHLGWSSFDIARQKPKENISSQSNIDWSSQELVLKGRDHLGLSRFDRTSRINQIVELLLMARLDIINIRIEIFFFFFFFNKIWICSPLNNLSNTINILFVRYWNHYIWSFYHYWTARN